MKVKVFYNLRRVMLPVLEWVPVRGNNNDVIIITIIIRPSISSTSLKIVTCVTYILDQWQWQFIRGIEAYNFWSLTIFLFQRIIINLHSHINGCVGFNSYSDLYELSWCVISDTTSLSHKNSIKFIIFDTPGSSFS